MLKHLLEAVALWFALIGALYGRTNDYYVPIPTKPPASLHEYPVKSEVKLKTSPKLEAKSHSFQSPLSLSSVSRSPNPLRAPALEAPPGPTFYGHPIRFTLNWACNLQREGTSVRSKKRKFLWGQRQHPTVSVSFYHNPQQVVNGPIKIVSFSEKNYSLMYRGGSFMM